jgi:hypothetical protein
MARFVRPALALGAALLLVLATVSSASAGGRKVFSSTMVGIPTGGLALFGVAGGGIPWVIDEGRATLTADGRLHVEVEGLVLATNHTNPIATGRAIVACGGAAVASTDAVPFSSTGDAEVDATVSLPSPCLAPAVFFAGVTAGGDRWFAVTGL